MKDLKPNQKIYLSLLCIPIPSSSSIIDTHTQTKQILLRHQTHAASPEIWFLFWLVCIHNVGICLRSVFVGSLSLPPLVVDVWILFSPVYTAICFFLSDDESVGQTFFLKFYRGYTIHHSTQCTLHVGLTFVGSRKQLKLLF